MSKKQSNKMANLLLLGIILVATNLRAPLTSVGSLVGLIKGDLGLTAFEAGLITTIPLLCFALISPIAPKLAAKYSIEKTVFVSLVTLTIGIVLRSLSASAWLFVGTILIGGSIAICNVLIPALIKKEFSHKSGVVTGMYSVSMNLSGAIASGISFPLAEQLSFGWARALQFWAILAIVAIIGWLPQLKGKEHMENQTGENDTTNIWQSKIAWFVTVFMGLQSLVFYVLVAWLPEILVQNGIAATKAGVLLSVVQLTMLPITFVVPIIAEKQKDQKVLVILTSVMMFLGIALLLTGNATVITLAMVFFGIGCGSAFSLAMMFFSLRTTSVKMASELSGMAQSIGYLFASLGPVVFGGLYDLTHSWNVSLYVLLGVVLVFCAAGIGASANKKI